MGEKVHRTAEETNSWTKKQVFALSAICIVVGLVFGFLLRGSEGSAGTATTVAAPPGIQGTAQTSPAQEQLPSLADMKGMAEKKVEPLLVRLKKDPDNAQLLIDIGNAYKSAHQFKDAVEYYQRVLDKNPKDVHLRVEVAEDLYYAGETEKSEAIFEEGLKLTPNDPGMLVDLGLLKFRSHEPKAAVKLWERALSGNPNLPADKKQQLENMIAQAKSSESPASR